MKLSSGGTPDDTNPPHSSPSPRTPRAPQAANQYDQALKRTLARARDSFLALVAPGNVWRAERSPELPALPRTADFAWEVTTPGGKRGILHIELQTVADELMGERLAEYGLRLWRRDHVPVRSIVVYLQPTAKVVESPFLLRWDDDEIFRYQFTVVRLWEIPAERVLAPESPYLWPIAPLMGGMTPDRTLELLHQLAEVSLPPAERQELTTLTVVLAGMRLGRDTILDVLRRTPMIDEFVKSSGLAEYLSANAQAKAQAKAQVQTRRQDILLVLETRFGPLDDALRAAIEQFDEAHLTEVLTLAVNGTLEQVRERVGV